MLKLIHLENIKTFRKWRTGIGFLAIGILLPLMINKKYWVPRNIVVELTIPASHRRSFLFEDPGEIEDWKEHDSAEPRRGTVTITFKDYRSVNEGLSDEVFKMK